MNGYKHKSKKKKTLRDFFNFCLLPKGKHFLKKEKRKKKNRFLKFFGVFFALAIGLSFWAVFAFKNGFFETSRKIESYEKYDSLIWPVVMEDPPNFDEKNPLDEKIKIKSALWDTAMNLKDKNLDYDENDMIIFPANEVQKSYEKLFGEDINYDILDDAKDPFYKFNKIKKEFSVKIMSGTDRFFPHTIDAFWKNNNLILKVGYMIPQEQFDENMAALTEIKTEKFANYKLKKNKKTGNFYISSVF